MCSCIRVRMFRFRYRQFSCYDLLQFRLDELWKLNIFFWSSLCNKLRTLPKKTLDIQMNCSCRGNIYINPSWAHELTDDPPVWFWFDTSNQRLLIWKHSSWNLPLVSVYCFLLKISCMKKIHIVYFERVGGWVWQKLLISISIIVFILHFDPLREAVKYYFADFVRKGGGVPPQIRNLFFWPKLCVFFFFSIKHNF